MQTKYKVCIMEYERGWGSKVDEVEYFATEEEAKAFVTKYNAKNTSTVVPDWYMVALDPVKVSIGDDGKEYVESKGYY